MTAWTKPFYGVQHLKPCPPSGQITVEDNGASAECSVKLPHAGRFQSRTFDTLAEAMAYGERQHALLFGGAL